MTDEIHRAALAASIPPTIRWLDAAAVGAMLGYSARHVLQRIACRPDFPTPRNLGGHPRWKASEVDAWASVQPARDLGRRRVVVGPKAA